MPQAQRPGYMLLHPPLLPGTPRCTRFSACAQQRHTARPWRHPAGRSAATTMRWPRSALVRWPSEPCPAGPVWAQGEIVPATRERLLDLFYAVNRKDTDAVRAVPRLPALRSGLLGDAAWPCLAAVCWATRCGVPGSGLLGPAHGPCGAACQSCRQHRAAGWQAKRLPPAPGRAFRSLPPLQVVQQLVALGIIVPTSDLLSIRRSVKFFVDNINRQAQQQEAVAVGWGPKEERLPAGRMAWSRNAACLNVPRRRRRLELSALCVFASMPAAGTFNPSAAAALLRHYSLAPPNPALQTDWWARFCPRWRRQPACSLTIGNDMLESTP